MRERLKLWGKRLRPSPSLMSVIQVFWSNPCSFCLDCIVYSGLFTYPSVCIKGQLHTHPPPISPSSLQFLWNVSYARKNLLICKFFRSQISFGVCVCVYVILIMILSSWGPWTISCSFFPHGTNYSVGHKIRTPLNVWWLIIKRINEKCQPGVMY